MEDSVHMVVYGTGYMHIVLVMSYIMVRFLWDCLSVTTATIPRVFGPIIYSSEHKQIIWQIRLPKGGMGIKITYQAHLQRS
jgi:hypothetical protein